MRLFRHKSIDETARQTYSPSIGPEPDFFNSHLMRFFRNTRHAGSKTVISWLERYSHSQDRTDPELRLEPDRWVTIMEITQGDEKTMAYLVGEVKDNKLEILTNRAAYTRYLPMEQGGPPLF